MALTPAEVVRTWFEELWNRGDETTIDRLLHPDGIIHGLPTPLGSSMRGPDEFRPFYRAFRGAFPDIAISLLHVVEQGDIGIGHCRIIGVQRGDLPDLPTTHRAVDFTGFGMARVVDGQVRESWNCFDFLTMFRQLGVDLDMPARSRGAGQ